jgi:cytochrome d ubiquinol oxidase subunit II
METFLGIELASWWYLVVGAAFTGYVILDGFDLGVGMIHLFFKKEESRRISLNAIGPVWDGNEVWLVIGGGALFAGFPEVYASLFSAFYIPFMLFLVMIIFRAVSIEFRSKEPMIWWRKMWDTAFAISSGLIAFLLGVVLGNVLLGFEIDAHGNFTGSWLDFLNPYSILVGVTTVAMFMMHGSLYLVMKTRDRMYAKLSVISKNTTIFFVVTYLILTLYTLIYIPHLTDNFTQNPTLFILPLLAILLVANITRQVAKRKFMGAFVSSALSMAILLILVAIELFPVILLSSTDPAYSLTAFNASASEKTLEIMLAIAAIAIPLVGFYTGFVFWTFRGKTVVDKDSY